MYCLVLGCVVCVLGASSQLAQNKCITDAPTLEELAPLPDLIQALLPSKPVRVTDIIAFPIPVSMSGLESLSAMGMEIFSQNPSNMTVENAVKLLPTLHIPDYFDLQRLERLIPVSSLDGFQSFRYRGSSSLSDTVHDIWLPFWVLTFWLEVLSFRSACQGWAHAVEWVGNRAAKHGIFQGAQACLTCIPWGYKLAKKWGNIEITSLARFLSHKWLTDENIAQLSEVLKKQGCSRIGQDRSMSNFDRSRLTGIDR